MAKLVKDHVSRTGTRNDSLNDDVIIKGLPLPTGNGRPLRHRQRFPITYIMEKMGDL